jgi:putative addiction module killer protein
MIAVRQTREFRAWMTDLRDRAAKPAILRRIDRLARGNPDDAKPIGEGVSEMRIHFGPGYRVYFVERGLQLVVLLCGGDKSSQGKDIEKAKALARAWIDEEDREE